MALHTCSKVVLHSNDRELEKGFERVKHQALEWVFEGYPVGDYYEAALPHRNAFCMRDVSHQCIGGEVLGLSSHNKNMFSKFAKAISEKRDWCSFWEIDRWDHPCPVDYKNDEDFWYNLPANFDVLHACWKMYLWTGDSSYLNAPEFEYFYAHSMNTYIKQWDRDGDGLPDRKVEEGRRGVAGYDENQETWNSLLVATDTIAAMARAHLSYADMCARRGEVEQETIYRKRGEELLERLSKEFFIESRGFARGLKFDGTLLDSDIKSKHIHLLYWDTVRNHERQKAILDGLAESKEEVQIEELSHFPEIQWRYGRHKEAMSTLRLLMDPHLHRKEYPEASYSTIGAIATGLMGITPDANGDLVMTRPGLSDVEWVELGYVPLLGREVTVYHEGNDMTSFRLERGEDVIWRIAFWGTGTIDVSDREVVTLNGVCEFTGKQYVYADVLVTKGETITAKHI